MQDYITFTILWGLALFASGFFFMSPEERKDTAHYLVIFGGGLVIIGIILWGAQTVL